MNDKEKNVILVLNRPVPEHTIGEMVPGESGYTVPWAYEDGVLDEDYSIGRKGGTVTLRVECMSPGKYAIVYEEVGYDPI